MLRLLSCQHATLLLEQRAEVPLGGSDRLSLGAHLLYCPYCQRYSEQTVLVARLAQAAARPNPDGPGLSDATKARLRALLAG